MIPNQWYAVLESREVKPGKPIGVTRMGEKMVFWRDQAGQVIAMSDLCPHRGVALSAGKVKGDCIMCPFHGFEFDNSGRCVLIPANGKNSPIPKAFQVKSYPAYEAHDFIFIYWGEAKGDIGKPPWFDDIDGSFSYASMVDPWNTHYFSARSRISWICPMFRSCTLRPLGAARASRSTGPGSNGEALTASESSPIIARMPAPRW